MQQNESLERDSRVYEHLTTEMSLGIGGENGLEKNKGKYIYDFAGGNFSNQ